MTSKYHTDIQKYNFKNIFQKNLFINKKMKKPRRNSRFFHNYWIKKVKNSNSLII